jgi:rapamycin-insensitive companion of mTOR
VFLPPHFFGELAKTKEGCDLLEKTQDVQAFINTVKDPKSRPLEKRAALWALVCQA